MNRLFSLLAALVICCTPAMAQQEDTSAATALKRAELIPLGQPLVQVSGGCPKAPPSLSISQHSCHGTNHTLCLYLHQDREDPKEIRKTHPLLDTWRHLTSFL